MRGEDMKLTESELEAKSDFIADWLDANCYTTESEKA